MSFLGFIISARSVQMDPAKNRVVTDWPTPSTCKKLQRFVGYANFYRHFISSSHRHCPHLSECSLLVLQLNSRQARWALFFNHFDFSLSYRPGSKNIKPNALSWQFQPDHSSTQPGSVLPPACIIGSNLRGGGQGKMLPGRASCS